MAMRLNNLQKPCTFYYEAADGALVPFELTEGFPTKWYAQHSKGVEVRHSICFGTFNKDNWFVRALKWIIANSPNSWKKDTSNLAFSTTINCCYPVVKYLVENRNWSFNDACVAAGDMCENCLNQCLSELEGLKCPPSNTHCLSCKAIDPAHHYDYITRRMYRAMKNKENIIEIWSSFRGTV
jgi:hypothetical protein